MTQAPELTQRISRTSLGDSVYETLLEAILSGQFTAGTELNAVELAAKLDVSRTPVQEAIRRLEADGLVEHRTGRKARVARFSRPEILEIYEVRGLLEAAVAERAAARLSDEQLERLAAELSGLQQRAGGVGWAGDALEFDLRLHDILGEACGNGRLVADVLRYRLLVRSFCRMTGTEENLRAALRELGELLAALRARDAAAARAAMLRHIHARKQAAIDHVFGEA